MTESNLPISVTETGVPRRNSPARVAVVQFNPQVGGRTERRTSPLLISD